MTGSQQASSATARNVFFTVTGTNAQSERMSLGLFQRLAERDAFQEDTHDDMIIETDQHLGDVKVVGVGLEYDPIASTVSNLLDCHWYVAFISIIDFQNERSENHFPCYHWVGYTNKEVTAVSDVGKSLTDMHTQTHIHTPHTHVHTDTHICTHTHTHTHTHIHATHTYTPRSHVRTHTTHTIHTHAHIHTDYLYVCVCGIIHVT